MPSDEPKTNHKPLPPGWVWTVLDSVTVVLDSKRVPINAEERQQRIAGKSGTEVYPYYGATGQVGHIDGYLFDEELVLLGEDGAPFLDANKDKAYVIRGKAWVNNHAHVLRAVANVSLNQYICHYLNRFDFHGYVTGTTRLKLNQSQMNRIPIPLPPLAEQRRIVAEVERRLSVVEEMEQAVESNLARAGRLRQAVLRRAFEGRLVPQDPSDEPAEKLLERIRAAREGAPNAPRPTAPRPGASRTGASRTGAVTAPPPPPTAPRPGASRTGASRTGAVTAPPPPPPPPAPQRRGMRRKAQR